MIATRRGLAVLLAIAALLGVLLVREVRRERPPPENRAIVPGVDPDRITQLTWARGPLPPVTVTSEGAGRWTWVSDSFHATADTAAIRDVLAALRAGRWHRRAEGAAAGQLVAQLSIKADGATRIIGIGAELPGTEQQWLVVGDRALLVDRWVAHALDPSPLALRVRRPAEDVWHADILIFGVNNQMFRIDGTPPRETSPFRLLVREDLVAALRTAIEGLEIVQMSRAATDTTEKIDVRIDDSSIVLGETCPDDPKLAWLESDAGEGCITRAAYDAVKRAIRAIEDPEAAAEPRILPVAPKRITLADGSVLDLEKRPMIGTDAADPARVTELLAALAASQQVVPAPEKPVVRHTLQAEIGGGPLAIELLDGNLVHRESERVALRVTPEAYAVLARGAADYRDRTVWNEEPTTIAAIQIDGVTYTRGAVIGEWTRTPAGTTPVDGARVEALVTALASVTRAPDVAAFAKVHEVTLTLAAPGGAAAQHVLAVAAPRQGGCIGHAGSAAVALPAPVCASISALAR